MDIMSGESVRAILDGMANQVLNEKMTGLKDPQN